MDHTQERPTSGPAPSPAPAFNAVARLGGGDFRVPSTEPSPREREAISGSSAVPAANGSEEEAIIQLPKRQPVPLVQDSFVGLGFDNDMSMPISVSSARFHRPQSINPTHLAMVTGSTQTRLHSGMVRSFPNVITKVSYTNDGQYVDGFILAIASGDHASTICDTAIKMMSEIENPAGIDHKIFPHIATTCAITDNAPGASSTSPLSTPAPATSLACVRVYQVGENQFQVCGFNVGSNVIVAINPDTKEVTELLPASALREEVHADEEHANEGDDAHAEGHLVVRKPVYIQNFVPAELVAVQKPLIHNALLLAMSEKVHSHLELRRFKHANDESDEEAAETEATFLSYSELVAVLPHVTSAESYADQLLQSAVFVAESKRLVQMHALERQLTTGNLDINDANDFVVGGDLALAVARVSEPACNNALRHRMMLEADGEFAALRAKVAEYKNKPDEKQYGVIAAKFAELTAVYFSIKHLPGLVRVADSSSHFASSLLEAFAKSKNPIYIEKIVDLLASADKTYKQINYKQARSNNARAILTLAALLFERYFQTSDSKFSERAEGLLHSAYEVFLVLGDTSGLLDVAKLNQSNAAQYFLQYLKTREVKHINAALAVRDIAHGIVYRYEPATLTELANEDIVRATKLFSTYLIDGKTGEFPAHAFRMLELAEGTFKAGSNPIDGLKTINQLFYRFAIDYGKKYMANDIDMYFRVGFECLRRAGSLAQMLRDEETIRLIVKSHLELASALVSLFHDSMNPKYAVQAKLALGNLLIILPENDVATRILIADIYLDLAGDVRQAYRRTPKTKLTIGSEGQTHEILLDEYADELLARANAIYQRDNNLIGQIRVCFQQGDLGMARYAAEFGNKKPDADKADPRIIILRKADDIIVLWDKLYPTAEYKNFVLQGLFCEQVLDYLVNTVEFLNKCKALGYNPTGSADFDIDAKMTEYLAAIAKIYGNIVDKGAEDILDTQFVNRTNPVYLKAMEEFFTNMGAKLQRHVPAAVELNKEMAETIATELHTQQEGLKPKPAAEENKPCVVM